MILTSSIFLLNRLNEQSIRHCKTPAAISNKKDRCYCNNENTNFISDILPSVYKMKGDFNSSGIVKTDELQFVAVFFLVMDTDIKPLCQGISIQLKLIYLPVNFISFFLFF